MKNKLKFWIYPLAMAGALLLLTNGCKETVTDIDGNVYKTVKIGSQLYMAENLKVTKFNNGDLIKTTNPLTFDLSADSIPEYQWPCAGNESDLAQYGRLYTWYAVNDSRKICPEGWHVITNAEWSTLAGFFGGENQAGTSLKETGTVHWIAPNSSTTNSSGFTALPGGGRGRNGAFGGAGYYGAWWSSDEIDGLTAWYWNMYYNSNSLKKTQYHKNSGFSVRCVK